MLYQKLFMCFVILAIGIFLMFVYYKSKLLKLSRKISTSSIAFSLVSIVIYELILCALDFNDLIDIILTVFLFCIENCYTISLAKDERILNKSNINNYLKLTNTITSMYLIVSIYCFRIASKIVHKQMFSHLIIGETITAIVLLIILMIINSSLVKLINKICCYMSKKNKES